MRKRMLQDRINNMLFHTCKILIIFALLFSQMATAKPFTFPEKETQESYLFDHMSIQSGGYLGYVNIGVGKDLGRHKINLSVGYVPKNIGGHEIWQFNFKYDWLPSDIIKIGAAQENIWLDPFYIGISVIYGLHNNLFLQQPEQYPPGYYSPTALRTTLNFGSSLKYNKYTFFVEFSIIDVGLIAYINHTDYFMENYDYLGLEGIGSLAVGVKFEF